MVFRVAVISDIKEIQFVRNSVTENRLSDPAFVSDQDCENYLVRRGKGWVCKEDNKIVGFAIVDLLENNIWALFIHPDYENRGIGKKLHDIMLNWYFYQTRKKAWLSTAPGTRAEKFYTKAGWKNVGFTGKGEVKFEINFDTWKKSKS